MKGFCVMMRHGLVRYCNAVPSRKHSNSCQRSPAKSDCCRHDWTLNERNRGSHHLSQSAECPFTKLGYPTGTPGTPSVGNALAELECKQSSTRVGRNNTGGRKLRILQSSGHFSSHLQQNHYMQEAIATKRPSSPADSLKSVPYTRLLMQDVRTYGTKARRNSWSHDAANRKTLTGSTFDLCCGLFPSCQAHAPMRA